MNVGAELPAQPVRGAPTPDAYPIEGRPRALDVGGLVDQLVDAVVVADGDGVVRMVNAAAARLFRRTPDELVGVALPTLVPSRLRAAHEAGFRRFVQSGRSDLVGGLPIRVPALCGDGQELMVELSLGAMGRPGERDFLVVSTVRDVSGRVELERQALLSRSLQASVDAARDGVLAVSADQRVLAVNRRFCELWGLDLSVVTAGAAVASFAEACLAQVEDGEALLAELDWTRAHPAESRALDIRLRDGRLIEGYAAPIVDDGHHLGRVYYLHDDTARREAEAQRANLLAELARVQRSQRFLLDVSTVLAHATGFADTLRSLAAVAVPTLGDLCLIDVVDDGGRLVRMAAVHADPARQPLVDELHRHFPPDPAGEHPSVVAVRRKESSWSAEMTEEFLRATSRDERHFQIITELGFTSYMTVPLVADDRVLGTVTLVSAGSGRRFGERDLALAEELASRVALVVAKERQYDVERRISHTLQANLLPTDLPSVPGLSFAVRYLAGTRDAEVGGDFWDVVAMPTGEVALAIGDVAGHDTVAAATMAQLRSACRAIRAQTAGPDDLLRALQGTWDLLGLHRMATVAFARVHPRTGRLRISSAGHPPPLVVEQGRAWFVPVDPAAPLGAPATAPQAWAGVLPRGAAVLFYTDGLVEDRHRDIDEGAARVREAALASGTTEAERLAEGLLERLGLHDRADDVALLVVTRD